MNPFKAYRLRLKRKRYLIRAFLKSGELSAAIDRTANIQPKDILLFCTARNERIRLPFFLKYYRDMGVNHFIFVDNDSDDETSEYLLSQPDCSVWFTNKSYKSSRFGMDWQNWLLRKYGSGHWCLVIDPDEFLIYPFCDTRPLRALTDWLENTKSRALGSLLLDMYPKGPIDKTEYQEGQNPFEIASWFDPGNYMIKPNSELKNLWIQGGVRARTMFDDVPARSPALNKIPLVKWQPHYVYYSSTHALLPRGLNKVYEDGGGEKTSGILLHAKFLNLLGEKAREELTRGEHYSASIEYRAYAMSFQSSPDLWCKWSEQYINWRQLEILGLMSKGNWA